MNIDFKIQDQQLPIIQINFEQLKESLQSTMSKYSNLVVTEDTLKGCKATKKELAGIRTKIETYRKDIKKKMSVPIVEFEDKCKELVALVEDAEKPIQEGIKVYDDARREEKRQKAIDVIKNKVAEYELSEKYASQLTVIDQYTKLSATAKEVKEDVEKRAFILKEKQNQELEIINILLGIIETENKTIQTKLQLSDFQNLINMGMPTGQVIEEIQKRAERTRVAEKPKEVIKPIAEPTPQPIKEESQTKEEKPQLYYVSFKVTGTKTELEYLSTFMKSRSYQYEVLEKGLVE